MRLELAREMAAKIHVENHVDRRRYRRALQIERNERRQTFAADRDVGIDRDEAGVLLRQNPIEDEATIDGARAIRRRRRVVDQWREIDCDELDPVAQ